MRHGYQLWIPFTMATRKGRFYWQELRTIDVFWLHSNQRISFKVLLLTYQSPDGTAPQYMTDLLSRYQPTRSLRSSDALLLTAPQSRLASFGDRAFQHAVPRLWNGLPISLRSANNLNSFKKALSTFLFKDACNV